MNPVIGLPAAVGVRSRHASMRAGCFDGTGERGSRLSPGGLSCRQARRGHASMRRRACVRGSDFAGAKRLPLGHTLQQQAASPTWEERGQQAASPTWRRAGSAERAGGLRRPGKCEREEAGGCADPEERKR
ncbi:MULTISPECIES: hypothetical protein [Paenibacillus]|uniref:hypothetical protein n=1 Tax=Paenibacillus TaxID=44249 RepID=UPI0022B8F17C|nr:hypothetical protein [Paenibacillus caseinilyticus]MCZ8518340.1 hypothetical protein [Paenibacillus caseinilyticus]